MRPGTRVTIKPSGGDSLFAGQSGIVIKMTATEWDSWVMLDHPIMGNTTFGFNDNELEVAGDGV